VNTINTAPFFFVCPVHKRPPLVPAAIQINPLYVRIYPVTSRLMAMLSSDIDIEMTLNWITYEHTPKSSYHYVTYMFAEVSKQI
jgi:hypothetical protein